MSINFEALTYVKGEVSQNGFVLAFGLIHTGLVCHRKMPCTAAIHHLTLCKSFIFIFKKGVRHWHVPDCFCSSPGFNRACCSGVFQRVKISDIIGQEVELNVAPLNKPSSVCTSVETELDRAARTELQLKIYCAYNIGSTNFTKCRHRNPERHWALEPQVSLRYSILKRTVPTVNQPLKIQALKPNERNERK